MDVNQIIIPFSNAFHPLIAYLLTFIIPMAPIFSPYEVVPLPVPMSPASRQPKPSTPMPLLTAWCGTGGAPVEKKDIGFSDIVEEALY